MLRPSSVSYKHLGLFLLPALAFLVSLFVAWRCTRGTPAPGTLITGLTCAAIATLATTALLAFAIELAVRRVMPGAVPVLVGAAFVGLVSLPVASALNLTLVALAVLATFGARSSNAL